MVRASANSHESRYCKVFIEPVSNSYSVALLGNTEIQTSILQMSWVSIVDGCLHLKYAADSSYQGANC